MAQTHLAFNSANQQKKLTRVKNLPPTVPKTRPSSSVDKAEVTPRQLSHQNFSEEALFRMIKVINKEAESTTTMPRKFSSMTVVSGNAKSKT